MIVGEKVRLYPTKEQEGILIQNCHAARFCYNACLAECIRAYEEEGVSYSFYDLQRYALSLRHQDETNWLLDISSSIPSIAGKDVYMAFQMFFKRGNRGYPKFKKRGKAKMSFGLYTAKSHCRFNDETHIKISKMKEPIRIKRHYVVDKLLNPRISFDGKFWYFSYSYEYDEPITKSEGDIVGVDLGIKDFAVCSDGVVYKNINKTKRVRQLEKRKRHLQRKLSKKYEMNRQGRRYVKTNNIIKLERTIRLIDRKLRNIRDTYIHTVTYRLVTRAKLLCIEDLNVSGMMKNKHLSKAIQQQCFYKFRQYLAYKCQAYGCKLVIADRFYPSTKTMSCCGFRHKFVSLSQRVLTCPVCGKSIDRDLNAAINLRSYALAQ